jgi:hypothetical protein
MGGMFDCIGQGLASNRVIVRDTVRYFLAQFLNFSSKFPSISGVGFGASRLSSVCSEDELKSLIEDQNNSNFVRHFILSESTIITTIEIPSKSNSSLNQVALLIRDSFGKYCFHSKALYSSSPLQKPNSSNVNVCSVPISLSDLSPQQDSSSVFSELTSFLEKSKSKENIIDLSNSQHLKGLGVFIIIVSFWYFS